MAQQLKRIHCSSRGTELRSQHPHSTSQPPVSPEHLKIRCSLWPLWAFNLCMHIHVGKTLTYAVLKKKNTKETRESENVHTERNTEKINGG